MKHFGFKNIFIVKVGTDFYILGSEAKIGIHSIRFWNMFVAECYEARVDIFIIFKFLVCLQNFYIFGVRKGKSVLLIRNGLGLLSAISEKY